MNIKNGSRRTINGWVHISVRGKPYERGYAIGYLLAPEIKEAQEMLAYYLPWSYGLSAEYITDLINGLFRDTLETNYSEIYEEIRGITAGANSRRAKITLEWLIMYNCYSSIEYIIPHLKKLLELPQLDGLKTKYPDIVAIYGSSQSRPSAPVNDKCTGFMAVGNYTKDGQIVCAHSTFDNFIDGQYCNIILDITPSSGERMIFQSLPGWVQSGTDFFVTSAGIIGTETTIGGFNKFEPRDPIFCRIRKCMQYGKTLDDYVTFLVHNNAGDYANSWLIGDIRGNEIMRIELGLYFQNIEKTKNGVFIGFNAPYDDRIRNLECSNTGMYDTRRHQGARHVRLTQFMEKYKGQLTTELGKAILADHYDVYLNKENPCSRTCCSHYDWDPREYMSQFDRPLPYQPRGALDGIVCDSKMARKMSFEARWGRSCGLPFDKADFCNRNIQWKMFEPYLHDRPYQPWTIFTARKQRKSVKKYRRVQNKSVSVKRR